MASFIYSTCEVTHVLKYSGKEGTGSGDSRPYIKGETTTTELTPWFRMKPKQMSCTCGSIYHWWRCCDKKKRDKRDILLYYAQEAEEVKINLLTFSRDEDHDAEDVKINLLA